MRNYGYRTWTMPPARSCGEWRSGGTYRSGGAFADLVRHGSGGYLCKRSHVARPDGNDGPPGVGDAWHRVLDYAE